MRPLIVLFVFMGAVAAAGQAPSTTPSVADLAAKMQAHYGAVRDFSANFTLQQTILLRPKASLDRGQVEIKKPGRMRWIYSTGGKQQFIADGTNLYSYFPEDKYVAITSLERSDDTSTALLFLTGRADLTKDFLPSLPAQQPADEWAVVLAPRRPQADYKTLTLQADRTTWQIHGFIVVDDQDTTSSYRFTNIKENQGVPDRDFEFTPPKGVEIRR